MSVVMIIVPIISMLVVLPVFGEWSSVSNVAKETKNIKIPSTKVSKVQASKIRGFIYWPRANDVYNVGSDRSTASGMSFSNIPIESGGKEQKTMLKIASSHESKKDCPLKPL